MIKTLQNATADDNDDDDDDGVLLEMQPIQHRINNKCTNTVCNGSASFLDVRFRITQLIIIIKLYVETYPRITSIVAACVIVALFFFTLISVRQPVKRNKLYHDYSKIDMDYNFKASQIDQWCLYGGDDTCQCDDFTEPLDRYEKKDWMEAHKANVDMIDPTKHYDVIFYGDEVTEGWNGRWLGKSVIPPMDGAKIKEYFNETFTKAGGGDFEGLALGIMGDVVCLLQKNTFLLSIFNLNH
jgi:hypothetical protein